MTPTHIRLTRADREDAAALILPIAGTIFELATNHQTIAITSGGKVYEVDECIIDIEEALGVLRTARNEA